MCFMLLSMMHNDGHACRSSFLDINSGRKGVMPLRCHTNIMSKTIAVLLKRAIVAKSVDMMSIALTVLIWAIAILVVSLVIYIVFMLLGIASPQPIQDILGACS